MKKWLIGAAVIVVGYQLTLHGDRLASFSPTPIAAASHPVLPADADVLLSRAYGERRSHVQVEGHGVIVKVLADDTEGSRHQRFIVRLASGRTILIAHNIDLAPRVAAPRRGDAITFAGEYEWNSQGGVVHWTHRDPAGRHSPGWIEAGGRLYQ